MYLNVNSVTPFANLSNEIDSTKAEMRNVTADLLAIQLEKQRLKDNLFRRFFQRGKISELEIREKELSAKHMQQNEKLTHFEELFNDWEKVKLQQGKTPEDDLREQLQALAEQDNLFFNNFLDVEAKLKPENHDRYDDVLVHEFNVEDYDIEATIDIVTVSYGESISSVEELYTKIKEKGGVLRYTENEQRALRSQINEVLEKNQYRLSNEGEIFTSYSISDGELVRESGSDRLSFSRMTQDLTTGVLEFSLEDNYLNTNYMTLSYDESEGIWRSNDIQLHGSAVDSLNRLVHVDHSTAFGKFYEKLSDQERSYITLLNESNREALDNAYGDSFESRSTEKADQLAQFEEGMTQERMNELKKVYNRHVHVGLPGATSPTFIEMDRLHLITSKYDTENLNRESSSIRDFSGIYSLGNDFKLHVEGGQYLDKENTVEIIETLYKSGGYKNEVLGRIHNLTESEAREVMDQPFHFDFEDNKFMSFGEEFSVGDPEPLIKINNIPEALVKIGKVTNKPNMTKMIMGAFENVNRTEEVELLQDEISKQEEVTLLSDQLKQLSADQLSYISLDIQENHFLEVSSDRSDIFDRISSEMATVRAKLELAEEAIATKFINAARSEIGGFEKLEKAIEQAEFELAFSSQKISEPQKVEARDRTQEHRRADMIEKMDTKEEVLSLYTKYLSGDELTYTERTSIVQYDQENGSFEQMQLRLEGLGRAMLGNPDMDFREKEDALMLARGEDEALQEIISKEYYDMSINERTEVKENTTVKNIEANKEQSKVPEAPGFMNYEEVSKLQLEEELSTMQEWINTFNSEQISVRDRDYFNSLEIGFGDGNVYFSYPVDDGVDIVDTLTKDMTEIISYKFSDRPELLQEAKAHLFEQLGLSKDKLLEQLAEDYDIKHDMAFTAEDYPRIFGFPEARSEKEIHAAINQQRSEKQFDWVYNETYPSETVAQYKEELVLNLQKKIIDGHQFYQIDEQMELMLQSSKENVHGYDGTIFKEIGDHETFSVNDSKAAAQRLADMGASACSKGSMSILKQFLAEDRSREHQQHLVHNSVMQATYQEETGRSMTGRR